MRDDVETPPRPPRKRRQLEQALDLWLAVWAGNEMLTPSERRRVREEQARRKAGVVERRVGIAGDHAGMSRPQKRQLAELLEGAHELHVDDVWGASAQAHQIGLGLGLTLVLHPPSDTVRAWLTQAERAEPARATAERAREIVQATTELVALPKEMSEPPDDRRDVGVWYTVRYARKRGGRITVVYPDGRKE